MKHLFRYSLLTLVLYSAAIFAAQCSVSNATLALHTNNDMSRFQPTSTIAPAFGNFGLGTQKRTPKKLPTSYSNNKDVGQTMLDHAAFLTFCDVKKHMPIIRDHIDERLGVNKDSWFRPFIGSYQSTVQAARLNSQEAVKELKIIDSLVSNVCYPGLFYRKLEEGHWYFNWLINGVIKNEAQELYKVQGSTIDDMWNEERRISDLSIGLSRFIMTRAKDLYSRWIHASHCDGYSPCRSLVALCREAFYNSKNSVEELIKLRDSQAMKELHIKMCASKRTCLGNSRTVESQFNDLNENIEKQLQKLAPGKDEKDKDNAVGFLIMLAAAMLL